MAVADRAEAVIIGGGVAGAADAFFLAREGISSVVLERSDQLGSLTTARAAACFRGQWDIAEFGRLVLESIDFYEHFAEETGLVGWDIGFRQQGWLFLCSTADGPERCERFVEGHRRLGVNDSQALVGREIRDRFPWVSSKATGGTYRALDGWVSPYEITAGFARASGADVRLRTRALGIVVEAGSVHGVVTDGGLIETKIAVIAAGPFSGSIAETCGVTLPLFAVRRQLASIQNVGLPDGTPVVADADNHSYWRPDATGALLGMPLDEGPGAPAPEPPVDWDFPATVLDAVARLTPFWTDVAAKLSQRDVKTIAGQYTCTSDVLPILGPVPGVRGLYVHSGDNGWGIESAPAAARVLAQSVAGKSLEFQPYSLDRTTLSGSGRRLVSNWP